MSLQERTCKSGILFTPFIKETVKICHRERERERERERYGWMDGCYVSCLIATVLWSVWIRPRNHHPARFFDLLASSNCYFSCHQNTFHEFDNVKRIQDLTSQMAIFIYKMTSNRLFSVHFYNSCQPFSFHCLFFIFCQSVVVYMSGAFVTPFRFI